MDTIVQTIATAARKTHATLGGRCRESYYQTFLKELLLKKGFEVNDKHEYDVKFTDSDDGQEIKVGVRKPDLVVSLHGEKIILELKHMKQEPELSQLMTYMHDMKIEDGLLISFYRPDSMFEIEVRENYLDKLNVIHVWKIENGYQTTRINFGF